AHGRGTILESIAGYELTDVFGTYRCRDGRWCLLLRASGHTTGPDRRTLAEARSVAETLTRDFPELWRARTLTGFRRKLKALSPERVAMFQTYCPPLRSVG